MHKEKMKQFILWNYHSNKNKSPLNYFLGQAIIGSVYALIFTLIINIFWIYWFRNFLPILFSLIGITLISLLTINGCKKKIEKWILIEGDQKSYKFRGIGCIAVGASMFGASHARFLSSRISENFNYLLGSSAFVILILFFVPGAVEYYYKCYLIRKYFPELRVGLDH